MKFILFFILTISGKIFAGVIPIVASYDGVGGIYGLGYEYQDADNKLLIGGTAGGASFVGGLYTRFINSNLELSLGGGLLNSATLETTYLRSLENDKDDRYLLRVKGSGLALGGKYWFFNDLITLSGSVTKSTLQFDKFYTEDGDEISLPDANLFDVETLSSKIAFNLNFFDNPRRPQKGLGFSGSINSISGRKGQSDQTITSYGALALIPLSKIFRLSLKGSMSRASVQKNKKYDTEAEVRDAFGVDCSSLANLTEREQCQNLENSLVDYVLANNIFGTADPLGGSSSLRSFRELRFKAANTAFYNFEFKTKLSDLLKLSSFGKDKYLDLVLFYDLGYASDDKDDLFDESKFSNGIGINFVKDSSAVKFQYAGGSDDSSSWSLTLGQSF